jgi:hypothetical protein
VTITNPRTAGSPPPVGSGSQHRYTTMRADGLRTPLRPTFRDGSTALLGPQVDRALRGSTRRPRWDGMLHAAAASFAMQPRRERAAGVGLEPVST